MVCFFFFVLLAFPWEVSGAPYSEIVLSQANWEKKTEGKNVFVKWYAPWCGHCQELAPKWEQMAKEWENHERVLVASVDCTKEEDWCVSLGIQGFPTLLFGDPSQGGVFLEPYTGDKTYEALSDFANKTLEKPVCSAGNPSLCDGPAKERIEKYWMMSPDEMSAAILHEESLVEQAELDFKQKFDAMQASYDKQSQEHEFKLAKMKSNIRLLKRFLDKK